MIQARSKEVVFYDKGDKTLAQVAQGGGRCPIPGNIQVLAGRGSKQSGLVENVHDYCGELDWVAFKGSTPIQAIL